MKKHVLLISGVAVVLLAALLAVLTSPAHAAAPDKLVCTGTVTGGTYHSVTVPKGATCRLIGVTVKHNVKALHAPKSVYVLDSVVGGGVHVRHATGTVMIGQKGCKYDPSVRTNVIVQRSHHVLICWVTGHQLIVTGNDGRITVRNSHFHGMSISRNPRYTGGRNVLRVRDCVSDTYIHVFHNDRRLVLKRNLPKPVVR